MMNNGKWKDDGMTMQRLVDMAEGMCFGDAPIDATNGTKTCPKCQGDGICHKCRRIPEEMKNCSCSYGTCMECGGKGYVNKDMFELMLESDGDDSKKQQNGKKGKVKEKDAPAGSSLLDFFGF